MDIDIGIGIDIVLVWIIERAEQEEDGRKKSFRK